jgi:hypothetical protein
VAELSPGTAETREEDNRKTVVDARSRIVAGRRPGELGAADEGDRGLSTAGVWFWVLSGAGIATSITGVGFGAAANSAYEDWKYYRTGENQDTVETYRDAANGFFITSGVLGLGALISAVAWAIEAGPDDQAKEDKEKRAASVGKGVAAALFYGARDRSAAIRVSF